MFFIRVILKGWGLLNILDHITTTSYSSGDFIIQSGLECVFFFGWGASALKSTWTLFGWYSLQYTGPNQIFDPLQILNPNNLENSNSVPNDVFWEGIVQHNRQEYKRKNFV